MVHNGINGVGVEATYSQSGFWLSVFSGIAVIGNWVTPSHRDQLGRPAWYDLLFSCGTDQDCKLDLTDIGASVRYHPGDACFTAGNALQHEVKDWKGGGQTCVCSLPQVPGGRAYGH
ncbi:hypothetical protein BC835DRAFT_1296731 [Cytidiella melzeri]|nr:hypothetical protein BC835DRAFT_1296731 [Cytidiella melzeri]